jgi:hypothetical protein
VIKDKIVNKMVSNAEEEKNSIGRVMGVILPR